MLANDRLCCWVYGDLLNKDDLHPQSISGDLSPLINDERKVLKKI